MTPTQLQRLPATFRTQAEVARLRGDDWVPVTVPALFAVAEELDRLRLELAKRSPADQAASR